MFIETASKRGDRINTTEIVRLWKDKDGVTVADLRDGKRERLGFGNPVNIVALAACEMLPAQPGFEHLVAYFGGDEDVSFSRQPIIGWRVDAIRPRPVVVDDWFEGANDYKAAIKYPDGQVVMPFDGHYDDEAAWRTAMEEHRKKQQKPG
jgi:hypothetical protein